MNEISQIKEEKETTVQNESKHRSLSDFELLYTSELYNMVYLGKSTTLIYGGLCLLASPFILLYPLETEFVSFFKYMPVRLTLSAAVFTIGLLLPRWFALATNDHVLNMYYCKKTQTVQFETANTFLQTIKYETNIANIEQIDKKNAFGCNNIICKESNKQFYVDTAYLDDDILELMGFINANDLTTDENLEEI